MTARRIGVGTHYLSVPEHRYYQRIFNWRAADYPNAMRIGRQTVSLPLSPVLTDADGLGCHRGSHGRRCAPSVGSHEIA